MKLTLFVSLVAAASSLTAGQIVVPNSATDEEAPGYSASWTQDIRSQQIYSSAEFPSIPVRITGIRLRRDASVGPFQNASANVRIKLSTTTRLVDNLSTDFATNVGNDEVTVFDGILTVSSMAPDMGGPNPFEMIVPFTAPFDFYPANGNLLLEHQVVGVSALPRTDGVGTGLDGASRAFALNSSATAASQVDTGADIVLFDFTPINTLPVFTKVTQGPVVSDGASSLSAAWADLNDDGLIDLMVANTSGNNLLYQNAGGGSFLVAQANPANSSGGNSTSVSFGDFDNDGILDLFVGNRHQNHFLYRGLGALGFTNVVGLSVTNGGPESYQTTWADYDNDGHLDLLIVNFSSQNSLYKNNGNGTFTKVTSTPLTSFSSQAASGTWADYDNDGLLDFFTPQTQGGANPLFHNDGNGSFSSVTASAITNAIGVGLSAAWGDFDNDGDVDLFVSNRQGVNFLYRNDSGEFTRIAAGAIVNDMADSNGATWGDYDNDGWLDLYVANGDVPPNQANFLYHNRGDGTFERITTGPMVQDLAYSASPVWADIDNDGALDLFVANSGSNNALYRNGGTVNHWLKAHLVGTLSNRSAIGARVHVTASINGITRTLLRDVSGGGGFGGQNLELHFGLGDATVIDEVRVEWPSGAIQVFEDVAADQRLVITEANTAACLVFQPGSGTFTNSVQVTIQNPINAGTVRYTSDGTDPNINSPAYSAPLVFTADTTLKARLFVNGFPASDICTAEYLRYVQPDIEFVPAEPLFTNQVTVTLVNNVGAGVIRYTLDGNTPTTQSPLYAGGLQLTTQTTLTARVFVNSFPVSDAFSKTYSRVYCFEDDGIPFAWRETYFGPGFLTDPRAAANADSDNDGYTNTDEYQYGTIPTDGASAPEILLTVKAIPKLTFTTIPGKTYRILRATSLNPPQWEVLEPAVLATGPELIYIDADAPDHSFYQIELVVNN